MLNHCLELKDNKASMDVICKFHYKVTLFWSSILVRIKWELAIVHDGEVVIFKLCL